jgi:hypothetical protein
MVYNFFLKSLPNPNYTPKDATVLQLKNSGNFRLIRNSQVVDSILKYDASNKYILERGEHVLSRMTGTWEAANQIMDLSIERDTSFYNARTLLKQSPPLINDPEKVRLFFNTVAEQARMTAAYIQALTWQRAMAYVHLRFIKKEYHLEND